MKKTWILMAVFCLAMSGSGALYAADSFEESFENDLAAAGGGGDGFRYGFSANVGYYSSSRVNVPNSTKQVEFIGAGMEVGGYLMKNIVQDTLDVEAGVVANLVFNGEDQEGFITSEALYYTVYGGLVFLPSSDYGISVGYISVLNLKSIVTDRHTASDPLQKYDIIGGKGVYLDYQGLTDFGFVGTVKIQHTILTIENGGSPADIGITSLNFGFKYN